MSPFGLMLYLLTLAVVAKALLDEAPALRRISRRWRPAPCSLRTGPRPTRRRTGRRVR